MSSHDGRNGPCRTDLEFSWEFMLEAYWEFGAEIFRKAVKNTLMRFSQFFVDIFGFLKFENVNEKLRKTFFLYFCTHQSIFLLLS